MNERVIALVDMDCFYVQVEERDNPHIKGKPAAVVQYNAWKGGGIIAVNYEARTFGIKRGMRGDEAREKCPNLFLIKVPLQREKANLTKYRNAGKEVITVLCDFADCVERASVDEAYIDLSESVSAKLIKLIKMAHNESYKFTKSMSGDLLSTWVVSHCESERDTKETDERKEGLSKWLEKLEQNLRDMGPSSEYMSDLKLAIGGQICEQMRAAVYERTGFKCSAGISHNKILSKLACGLHKPNQQTILPLKGVPELWNETPIGKVRNLGGKLGLSIIEDLKCETMREIAALSIGQLRGRFDDKTADWLFNLGKGFDSEPVVSRQLAKSVGCGKNFSGREGLDTREKVLKWIETLSSELSERLTEDQASNKRKARTLNVGLKLGNGEQSLTRSCPLPAYHQLEIAKLVLKIIQQSNSAPSRGDGWDPVIRNISLSASKFEDSGPTSSITIESMFRKVSEASSSKRNGKSNQIEAKVDESGMKVGLDNKKLRQSECQNPKMNKGKTESKSFFKKFMIEKGVDLPCERENTILNNWGDTDIREQDPQNMTVIAAKEELRQVDENFTETENAAVEDLNCDTDTSDSDFEVENNIDDDIDEFEICSDSNDNLDILLKHMDDSDSSCDEPIIRMPTSYPNELGAGDVKREERERPTPNLEDKPSDIPAHKEPEEVVDCIIDRPKQRTGHSPLVCQSQDLFPSPPIQSSGSNNQILDTKLDEKEHLNDVTRRNLDRSPNYVTEDLSDNSCLDIPKSPKFKSFFKTYLVGKAKVNKQDTSKDQDHSKLKLQNQNTETTSITPDDNSTVSTQQECKEDELNSMKETDLVESVITLEEIFPNLEEIDESLIPCLPEKLQREARAILKSRKRGTLFQTSDKDSNNKNNELNENSCDSVSFLETVPIFGEPLNKSRRSSGEMQSKTRNAEKPHSKETTSNVNILSLEGPSGISSKSSFNDTENSEDIKNLGDNRNNKDDIIVTCEKCGKKIPQWDYSEHLDYHLAVKIREDQFNEAKKHLKTSPTKRDVKKRKRGSSSASKSGVKRTPGTLDLYLKK